MIKSFRNHAQNCCIEYKGNSYTYKELDTRADKIATALDKKKLAEGSYIGVFCEDRYLLISAILGILKARLSFVPLGTTLPQKRLFAMIAQSKMDFIITDKSKTPIIDPEITKVSWLMISEMENQAAFSYQHKREYLLDDAIYVYFTSGTTGTPKGVIGRNRGLSHFIGWEISEFNIDHTFRFSQFTNPGFDVFMRDLFCASVFWGHDLHTGRRSSVYRKGYYRLD